MASGTSGTCAHCGSSLAAVAVPDQHGRTVVAAAEAPVHRRDPGPVAPRPQLSRKKRLTIAGGVAAVILAVAAFLVLRPGPPSPSGAVRDYFDHLGSGDTAAALSLVDTSGGFSIDQAPLLVPGVLAKAADRPSDVKVISAEPYAGDSRYTVVTARYRIGKQSIEQPFAVIATGDDQTPYRLDRPFLLLTAEVPGGMNVAVNGVAVDAAAVTDGQPVFPGAYQATTTGNALFAGATRAATYQVGSRGSTADIDLTQVGTDPGAAAAVQAAADRYLDANCVNGRNCPLQAPSLSWDQTTSWTITTYPQVLLSSAEPGRSQVSFATATTGSAAYSLTYTAFDGTPKTEIGTVPVDISGTAGIGDDGAIQIALGY